MIADKPRNDPISTIVDCFLRALAYLERTALSASKRCPLTLVMWQGSRRPNRVRIASLIKDRSGFNREIVLVLIAYRSVMSTSKRYQCELHQHQVAYIRRAEEGGYENSKHASHRIPPDRGNREVEAIDCIGPEENSGWTLESRALQWIGNPLI